jgi:hypothetical protein
MYASFQMITACYPPHYLLYLLEEEAERRGGQTRRSCGPGFHMGDLVVDFIDNFVVRLKRIKGPKVVATHNVVSQQGVDVVGSLISINRENSRG